MEPLLRDSSKGYTKLLNGGYSINTSPDRGSNAGLSNAAPHISNDYNDAIQDEEEEKILFRNNNDITLSAEATMTTYTNDEVFDDLEFLHDFLEADSRRPWFESNCFKCTCR
eukprot:361896_1